MVERETRPGSGNCSAADRLFAEAELAAAEMESHGFSATEIRSVAATARKEIEAADAPFRLGLVGEFRSGKSTLANALLGDALALTDIEECTGCICCYRAGPERGATLFFIDGREEQLSVEAANQMLSDRRHDAAFLASLDRVVFESPRADCDTELWDGPGIGGSAHNEELADRFLSEIGAAVWVLDATMPGNAAALAPVERLHRAGKRVLAVLNQTDLLSHCSQIEQVVEFVRASYGERFLAIVPISALEAMRAVEAGETNSELETLRAGMHEHLLANAVQDRLLRQQRALEHATAALDLAVANARRRVEEPLLLVDHVRGNLNRAKEQVLLQFDRVVQEEAELAWAGPFRAARKALESQVRTRRDITEKFLTDLIAEVIKDDQVAYVWDSTITGVKRRIEQDWNCRGGEAITLAVSAVSPVPASAPIKKDEKGRRGELYDAIRRSVEDGMFASGGSALALAGLAVFGVVAWPAILVAIPAGTAFGAISYFARGDPSVQHIALDEALTHLEEARQEILKRFLAAFGGPASQATKEALDIAVQSVAEKFACEVLDGRDEGSVRSLHRALEQTVRAMCGLTEGSGRTRGANSLVLMRARPPMLIEAKPHLKALLRDIGPRLDLVLPAIDEGLTVVLECLRPDTEIRIIVPGNPSVPVPEYVRAFKAAISGWGGKLEARLVWREDGGSLQVEEPLVITRDFAAVFNRGLAVIGERPLSVIEYSGGRLAAQREFAQLWVGISESSGALRMERL